MSKKKFILVVALAGIAFMGCNSPKENPQNKMLDLVNNPESASGEADPDKLPVMTFAKESHDFGMITQGEKVQYSFVFKNEGKVDLLIASASGSCGCTVPSFPKEPIPPGGEGKIDVTFDSAGKEGKQNKTVTLITNCQPNTKVLTIIGEVKTP